LTSHITLTPYAQFQPSSTSTPSSRQRFILNFAHTFAEILFSRLANLRAQLPKAGAAEELWKEWGVEKDRLFPLDCDDDEDDEDVSEMRKRGWWWDGQKNAPHASRHSWQHREAWETTPSSGELGMNTAISKHLVDSMVTDVKDPMRFLPSLVYLAGDARVRIGMLWVRLWEGDARKVFVLSLFVSLAYAKEEN
jgi:hypothetical protein